VSDHQELELILAACQARELAYAPYSGFPEGAAVRTAGGVFLGCNLEDASFGLTVCAERAAVSNAVAGRQRQSQMLALASAGGVPPCGACRQVLAEFCSDLTILLVDVEQGNRVTRTGLHDLLPHRFELGAE